MDANSPAAPSQQPPLPEDEVDLSRAAVGWTIALVICVSIATFSAASNKAAINKLERAAENTAVGDKRFYPVGAELLPSLVFEGVGLVPADKTPEPMPEVRMRLAGYTDDASFRLYVPLERENANGAAGGPSWYIKTAPGMFLRMSR